MTPNLDDLLAVSEFSKAGSLLSYGVGPHSIVIAYPVVLVRDHRRHGMLVAYSCTPADFDSSLEEFTADFMSNGME